MKGQLLRVLFLFVISIVVSVNSTYGQGLPEDFPEINVLVHDNPEPGYVFITPCGIWGSFPGATPYLAILDNYGVPVYFRELSKPAFDFKLQPNGLLSFSNGGVNYVHSIMDSTYSIIEEPAISGFSGTDFHEFLILENGNHLLLGWDDRLVDMDTVVPGGQPATTVRGALIQEKDTSGDVIWQWSSWDHMGITDTDTAHVDLTSGNLIDYVHANALDFDDDGNILMSSRNLHEITKISKESGDILWRMGGSRNEFSFIGEDTNSFGGQHDIRKLENGNYLMFDNGWFHPEQVSSALEFQIDEVQKTMTVVKRYRSQPEDILGRIMGSSQRLPGGNTLVGWGSGIPNVTEFKADGTKALELDYESVSYRAYKFPWKNSIFDLNMELLDFGEIHPDSIKTMSVELTNYLDEDIEIGWTHSHNDKFTLAIELPLLITAGSTVNLDIRFNPQEIGEFEDILTIYAERAGQTIVSAFAQQLKVMGTASEDASIDDPAFSQLKIYPNPVKDKVRIEREDAQGEIDISLHSVQGGLHAEYKLANGEDILEIDLSGMAPGLYIIKLLNEKSGKTYSEKLIKK